MKTDKKSGKPPPAIGNHDLVIAISPDPDTNEIEQRHMLCVVDSSDENIIYLKNVLQPMDPKILDERNINMYKLLRKPNSQWTLLKVCSLENFNRAYLGFEAFQICKLYEEILDLSLGVNNK